MQSMQRAITLLRTTRPFHHTIPRHLSLARSYSQSQHDHPSEPEQQQQQQQQSSNTDDDDNNNNKYDPLDNVLDRELKATKSLHTRSSKSGLSDAARDFNSMLDTLFPETRREGSPLPPPLPRKSINTTTSTPVDPAAAKKTKRIHSQIEKQLLNMVINSRKPHKKTSPLPRALMGSFYGKADSNNKQLRRDREYDMAKMTDNEAIAARDRETSAINTIVGCESSRQLLERVIEFTTSTTTTSTSSPASSTPSSTTEKAGYPPYYAKLLTRAIEMAGMTFQDPYLALSIFEHAKTHSVVSYVSGCTTEVYNAMLMMRWKLWRDVHGMVNLVDEMMANGVGYDNETRRIVQLVVAEVENEMRSDNDDVDDGSASDVYHYGPNVKDGMVWSMDERRSANIMKALVGKWLIK